MDHFLQEIFSQQLHSDAVPGNDQLTGWAERLICILYPQLSTCNLRSVDAIKEALTQSESELLDIRNTTTAGVS